MSEKLINAAQAIIERWDSPMWNWGEPTASLVHELRRALAEHQAQDEAKAAPQPPHQPAVSLGGWRPMSEIPDDGFYWFAVDGEIRSGSFRGGLFSVSYGYDGSTSDVSGDAEVTGWLPDDAPMLPNPTLQAKGAK